MVNNNVSMNSILCQIYFGLTYLTSIIPNTDIVHTGNIKSVIPSQNLQDNQSKYIIRYIMSDDNSNS